MDSSRLYGNGWSGAIFRAVLGLLVVLMGLCALPPLSWPIAHPVVHAVGVCLVGSGICMMLARRVVRVDPASQTIEAIKSLAGIPISRRCWSFGDVICVRVNMRNFSRTMRSPNPFEPYQKVSSYVAATELLTLSSDEPVLIDNRFTTSASAPPESKKLALDLAKTIGVPAPIFK